MPRREHGTVEPVTFHDEGSDSFVLRVEPDARLRARRDGTENVQVLWIP